MMNETTRYRHLEAAIFDTPWAIMKSKMRAIIAFADTKLANAQAIREVDAVPRAQIQRVSAPGGGRVAILPLFGTIMPRANMMTDISGGTSAEIFQAEFQDAVNDQSIAGIVIDVDSPGGSVSGIEMLASTIMSARGSKPIVAIANSLMASAAFWISTAADRVIAAPGSFVGSVGVVIVHTETSEQDRKKGITHTIITAGDHKFEGNSMEPLTDAARDDMQETVDMFHGRFVGALAKQRDVKKSAVLKDFGGGRVFEASEAKARGMVDAVGTMADAIEFAGRKAARANRLRAAATTVKINEKKILTTENGVV